MSNVDIAALNGNFKETYADKMEDLVPEFAKLLKTVTFQKGAKQLGNLYHQPVKLASGQGYTYNSDGSAFNTNSAVALVMKDAQVSGFELLRTDLISYGAISRSGGKNAFGRAVDMTIDDMVKGMTHRIEAALLYGGSGLATTASSVNTNATKTVVTMTAASWAGGIWAPLTNARINFYKDSDGTLVSSSADAVFVVSAVDHANKKLTITGTSTGITALDLAITAGACTVHFQGAKGVESTGLKAILSNAGTLFGVDGAAYSQWAGNTYSAANAPLTFGKIQKAVALAADKGLAADVDCFVSTPAWADLMNDLSAVRSLDQSYSKTKLENGSEAIEFYSANGKIRVIPHSMVKRGDAFIVEPESLSRIGSTDVSFTLPGGQEEYLRVAANGAAGYEVRVYSDQALFCDAPSHGVYISGIVPNA